MAKATIEYDLTDQDDKLEFDRANKSLDMALGIWEFGYNSKKKLEYEIEKLSETSPNISPYDVVDIVYAKFWEIMSENGINIDKLIV